MDDRPQILIVEDDPDSFTFFEASLQDHCEIFHAPTQNEVAPLLEEHSNIVLIIMDGNVPLRKGQEAVNTICLVNALVTDLGFEGTIVAASVSHDLNVKLVQAGAHAAPGKRRAAHYALLHI